jgi:hypothetical protein
MFVVFPPPSLMAFLPVRAVAAAFVAVSTVTPILAPAPAVVPVISVAALAAVAAVAALRTVSMGAVAVILACAFARPLGGLRR